MLWVLVWGGTVGVFLDGLLTGGACCSVGPSVGVCAISFGVVAFVRESSGNSKGSSSVFVSSGAAFVFAAVDSGGPLERFPICMLLLGRLFHSLNPRSPDIF